MADFSVHLKSAAWTGIEVGAAVGGAIAAQTMLDTKKVFAKEYMANPQWFDGPRPGAPFKIKHFGAIKAAGAGIASTYTTNPWVKLFLMGFVFQGIVEEVRMLSWDPQKADYRFDKIGAADTAKLDEELKTLAENYRTNGPEYTYGRADEPLGDRFSSAVAGRSDEPLGDRYISSVADPFGYETSDHSQAF